uniref:Si:ch211-194m7.5 n=1 Tax=Hucho hucho TaxID=62062 RepID=A0A4W5MWS2_9TELE
MEVEGLLPGLKRRLPQLEAEVSVLEQEDDGDLYGTVSLQHLIAKLNSTTHSHQRLNTDTAEQVRSLTGDQTQFYSRSCLKYFTLAMVMPHRIKNFGASYAYGSWGRDPKPAAGKESWFWIVPLTKSNVYSNFVRLYSSLSSLVVGVSVPGSVAIQPSNPTTNTIQGPNVVMYGDALYYNCYNKDAVCRFNITAKTVTTMGLPKGTGFNSKFNFCHLDACYGYTDMDLVIPDSPPTLGRTWTTSAHKRAVTNTFMACGVLYATRYLNKEAEEIFYSFDTVSGRERYDIGMEIKKMSTNIQSLNYSPIDHMLYAYNNLQYIYFNFTFHIL